MPNSRGLKPRKNNNWKVVVLSILAAATFWFFNALNKNYSTRLNYPLEFVYNEDSAIAIDPLPKQIYLDVNGGGWNLLRKTFWPNTPPIRIELKDPTDLKYYTQSSLVPILSGQLGGLKLNYVVTDSIFINIDEKASRKLKVLVDSFRIPLEKDLRLVSKINLSPDSVLLTGPKSLLNSFGTIAWGKFSQDKIDSNFDSDISIELPDNGLITPNVSRINVQFEVDKYIRYSMTIPLEKLRFPSEENIDLQDTVILLTMTVRENKISELNPSDFGVMVDFTARDQSDSTIIPSLMYYPDEAYDVELPAQKIKLNFIN
jgi:YbbR domain-containing protein